MLPKERFFSQNAPLQRLIENVLKFLVSGKSGIAEKNVKGAKKRKIWEPCLLLRLCQQDFSVFNRFEF